MLTVPGCATLRGVSAAEFGRELLRRRKLLDWSRRTLEIRSGVSESWITRIEKGTRVIGRRRIMDIGVALERAGVWSVADALTVAGEDPLSDEERCLVERSASLGLTRITQCWATLTDQEKSALLAVLEAFLDCPRDGGLTLPAGARPQQIPRRRKAAEPPDGDGA